MPGSGWNKVFSQASADCADKTEHYNFNNNGYGVWIEIRPECCNDKFHYVNEGRCNNSLMGWPLCSYSCDKSHSCHNQERAPPWWIKFKMLEKSYHSNEQYGRDANLDCRSWIEYAHLCIHASCGLPTRYLSNQLCTMRRISVVSSCPQSNRSMRQSSARSCSL